MRGVVLAGCAAVCFSGIAVASVEEMKVAFEANPPKVEESAILQFEGVEPGYDVYNCSIPFVWRGVRYIFGRVEPHDKWASSRTMLFRETGKDRWARVPEFGTLELEDPFVQTIGGELVLGGTRVTKVSGEVVDFGGGLDIPPFTGYLLQPF